MAVKFLAATLLLRGHHQFDKRLVVRAMRIVLSAFGMAIALWFSFRSIETEFTANPDIRIAFLAGLIALGLGVYAVLALVTKAASLSDIRAVLRRRALDPAKE